MFCFTIPRSSKFSCLYSGLLANLAIIEMILAMAETLGLNTVAEGVETERQADFLRRRGCSMAQGFLYSAGLPHEAFMDFIRGWSSKSEASRLKVG